MPKKKDLFLVADFYCCYLLQSLAKQQSFYIGSTPDPIRRLRQHNGEIKGGAWRTKKDGCAPWKMVTIVYGFPSNIAALQFEHAFQHAHQTRHIPVATRISKSKVAGRSLAYKLGNIRLLLMAPFFARMNLKVQIFDRDAYEQWCANKFGARLPDFTFVDQGFAEMSEFLQYIKDKENAIFARLKELVVQGSHKCSVCSVEVDYTVVEEREVPPLVSVCYHAECLSVAHLTCLARKALVQEVEACNEAELAAGSQVLSRAQMFTKLRRTDLTQYSQASRNLLKERLEQGEEVSDAGFVNPVVPVKATCVECGRVLVWSAVVKNATRLRAYAVEPS
ncbi:hypothetical protein BABINDRAFT_167212 [Babjeviella inositovora NRRL Y-12698]|uniref:GIY-YIG domain-containing protein n=1 Tax=Babjeviella inositovora NRRL Y-12698 TaxID=984486 RepID=A0A1E3QNS3_9ASCO|nr:uncharacterized protein BABINDRAFT_167212 [Babjeviella inositovora NRRL Y-12698]ODQ79343.1 hypothetical protein BABINDRAFT_167212 [Babjeviella inositovora NRRL Y-12698]